MNTNEDVRKISFDEWRLDLQFYPLGENNRASGFSLNSFFSAIATRKNFLR